MTRWPRWPRRHVYIPTVDHNRYYPDRRRLRLPRRGRRASRGVRSAQLRRPVRASIRAGVKMGMGSDAVFYVRPERARADLVRRGRHDAGAGAGHRHHHGAALAAHREKKRSAALRPVSSPTSSPSRATRSPTYKSFRHHNVKWVMKGGAVVVDRAAARARP